MAAENYELIIAMYKADDGTITTRPFDKVKFVVDDWQSIDVSEEAAKLLFVGHVVTETAGVEVSGANTQWEVTLDRAKEGSNWLISNRLGVSLEGR
jgi:hypothetical protein